jgi:hypothetical protein
MMCIHNHLARALETLELLGARGRYDYLVGAALETGGFFHQPEPANNWDSQQVEIKAHGVFASGTDQDEAIRNWMLVAARQSRVQQRVYRAEYLLRQSDTDPTTLRRACLTIIADGRTQNMNNAARATLADLDHQALQGSPQ